jgi:hypothetical protein
MDAKKNRGRRSKIATGILISVIISVLFILMAEGGLRLAGYGNPSSFLLKHNIDGRKVYINNIFYTEKFFTPELIRTPMPIVIDREKAENTIRIVIAGESAAIG